MRFNHHNPVVVSPVRAIKWAARNSVARVMNALSAVGYSYRSRPRHTSIDRLLGGLPRPVLAIVSSK